MTPDRSATLDVARPIPVPAPSESPFEAVPEALRAALQRRGFDELTAVQSAVLGADAPGRDLQISSQTGSGKTVALGFVLAPCLTEAAAVRGPSALIIVPTRELAAQVCEELAWLFADLRGVQLASLTGGTPMFRDRQALARGPRVVVGTPGRLLDHHKSGALDLSGVRELVLDEADQMLDMGFREELEGILDGTPAERRTHLVSATFPEGIQALAARYQREPLSIEGTRLGDANLDIEHLGFLVHPTDRYAALVNLLLLAEGERTLVFVKLRAEAQELAARLEADGFAALPLSGELVQSQRDRTLAAFRAGKATVLVATDVAARGLDVPDVMTVVHTSPPMDAHVYTHRSGRTGRAGKRGRSVSLVPPKYRRKIANLMSGAGVDFAYRPLPSAREVREIVTARARELLREELDLLLAAGPAEEHLEHAHALLAERDAAALVATLLARLAPAARAEPRDVEAPRLEDEPRRPHARPAGPHARSAARAPSAPGRRGAGMQRFFMNWGSNQGATPGRLLAAVCRRGEVTGTDIGGIAIHPNASTFDVAADVAERFEELAGRRDPRDPRTLIRRDRGPIEQRRPRR
jgi:ATP-dependent RNA helicase DeaD